MNLELSETIGENHNPNLEFEKMHRNVSHARNVTKTNFRLLDNCVDKVKIVVSAEIMEDKQNQPLILEVDLNI